MAASTRYSPIRRLAKRDGACDCKLIGRREDAAFAVRVDLDRGTVHRCPLWTRLATERSVYSNEGTA